MAMDVTGKGKSADTGRRLQDSTICQARGSDNIDLRLAVLPFPKTVS